MKTLFNINTNTITNKGTEASPSDPSFKCDKFEWSGDTLIMLNKHKNTKHIEQKLKSDNAKKHGNKDNFLLWQVSFKFHRKEGPQETQINWSQE